MARPDAFAGAVYPRGASLVEVSLTVLILAVALIPIFSLVNAGTRQVRFNEEHAVATLLASHIIERFRDEPPDWLAANLAGPSPDVIRDDDLLTPRDEPEASDFVKLLSAFERTVQFEPGPAGESGGTLVARIRWRPPGREPQEVVRKLMVTPGTAQGAVQ